MNPSSQPPKTGPTLVRETTPSKVISAEIVNDIPVRNPISPAKPQPAASPVAKVFKPVGTTTAASEDKELDHILRDVNSSVKQAENSPQARYGHLSGVRKKVAVEKAKIEQVRSVSPPIVATIVACLVALVLTAAAFYIYRNGY